MVTESANTASTPAISHHWGGQVGDVESPWYALRLYSPCLRKVADWLAEAGISYFVPMEYREVGRDGEKIRKELSPVVHNLIFVRKDRAEDEFKAVIADMKFKVSAIKKADDPNKYYEIPYRQMLEFQAMCNPAIEMRHYLAEDDARLKRGQPVMVTHGPLRGMTGKLVRSQKRYFLLKEVPGIAVMIKVSRWCCQPLTEK